MVDEDAPNHQNILLGLDLAAHVTTECPSACFDIPRCQRGGKGALESSGSGGNHVVDRGGAWFFDLVWIQAVVAGDCAMDAEDHGSRFRGKLCQANGAFPTLDLPFIDVCWL